MEEWQKFISGRWKGLVREGWQEVFCNLDCLMSSGEVLVDKPDRVVRRLKTELGTVYLKWTCGTERMMYFAKSFLRKPRSLAVWQICEKLLQAGLGCAEPLLAVSSRSISEFRFEDILVSSEIPYPLTSSLLLNAPDDSSCNEILSMAGKGIRKLHDCGFVHGDCLPGNICMNSAGKFFFLDNDRTVWKPSGISRKDRHRNLIQFCSRALYELPPDFSLAPCLDSYFQSENSSDEKEEILKKLSVRVQCLKKEFGHRFDAFGRGRRNNQKLISEHHEVS